MRRLTRIFRLTGAERRLLAKAFAWLVAARLGLMLFPVRMLSRQINRKQDAVPGAFTPRQAAWAISAAARRLPGTRCLAQSLALQGLLREAALHSELRIGVAKGADDGLIAHAWVVCEGEPVAFDEDLSRFTALPLLRS
jgi:hypothetical protein